jgi:chromosome segregation ATPase
VPPADIQEQVPLVNSKLCARALVGLVLAGILLALGSGQLFAQKKGNKGKGKSGNQEKQAAAKQLQAQLAAANQRLIVATAELNQLRAKVSAAQGSIDVAADEAKNSKSDADVNSQRVREIEEQLEQSQPKDSPLAQARADYLAAKEALEDATEEIFESEEYKAKYQAALKEGDRATTIPKLKSEALKNDQVYQRAKIVYDAVRQIYEQERSAVFAKSNEWVEATKATREARGEQTKAEQKVQSGALHKMSANSKLRDATKAALAAQAQVQKLNAALASLQGPQKKGDGKNTKRKK